ncbi:hypothetical protein [Mesorhizobium sp. CN2-181]|uniref:hypothetical protein n=1 Tax=Mesorhizobium yinganensis TaxID=3157707 RepID=UPI0032B84B23
MPTQPPRVYVCPVPEHPGAIATIKNAVLAASGVLVGETDTDLGPYKARVAACDIVVILICPETIGSADIAAVVAEATRLGKRIIGVWLDETVKGEPDWLAREGDGAVPLDQGKIETVIKGERHFDDPRGKPLPQKPTPRHKGH